MHIKFLVFWGGDFEGGGGGRRANFNLWAWEFSESLKV